MTCAATIPFVAVYAVDWHCYENQHQISDKYVPATAWVVGILIDEDAESLTIAHTVFDHLKEREARYVTVIPKPCIKARHNLSIEGRST